jgi:hypothetical protein
MFYVPGLIFDVPRASGTIFMFCVPGLIFLDTKGVGSCFLVFRSRTHFRRYRGRRVPFSCFVRPDSFSAIPRASGLVFMFCAPVLFFGGTGGVWSRVLVLRARTHFRRFRGRRVPFSSFAPPYSFSTVPRAFRPVFMFFAPDHVFGGIEGVGTHFHVLRSRIRFRRYRGHRVPFSYFLFPDSFSMVSGRRVPFSLFACPDLFSAVPGASGPFFTFCAPGLIFGGTGGVGSRVLILRARTHFRRFRGRRVTFSSFAPPYSFSAVPRASGSVFMFCAPGLVFGGTEGVVSRFHFLLPD